MIAFAMAKPSYSGEMVRKNRQVVLTIPGAALKDVVLTCGSCTGRDTDKAAKTGVDLVSLPDTPSASLPAPALPSSAIWQSSMR